MQSQTFTITSKKRSIKLTIILETQMKNQIEHYIFDHIGEGA